jgi:hypothetical protein
MRARAVVNNKEASDHHPLAGSSSARLILVHAKVKRDMNAGLALLVTLMVNQPNVAST